MIVFFSYLFISALFPYISKKYQPKKTSMYLDQKQKMSFELLTVDKKFYKLFFVKKN